MKAQTYYGKNIIVSPLLPIPERAKLKLSSTVNVGEQFRREFDKWLEETFGRTLPIHCLDTPYGLIVSDMFYKKQLSERAKFSLCATN